MKAEIWEDPKGEAALDEAEVPLWFWNAKLDKNELIRQMELQTQIGIKATDPHARTENGAGYQGGYLDQEWFDAIKVVLKYKKAHGEKMWLYDEIDWPAGTCGRTITLREDFREQYITIEKISVPAHTKFRLQLLTFEGKGLFGMGPETDYMKIPLNVHILDRTTGEELELKKNFSYEIFGPELEICPEHDCMAYLTQIRVDPYCSGGDESVNYLDGKATEAFLRSTYEQYAREIGQDLGTTVTTVFDDETRMCHAIPWSDEFAEAFLNRHGYDIRQELFRLVIPGIRNGRVRVDYFDTVAYLYQTRYFKKIHEWCENHKIRLFAHLLAEETPFGHVRYSGDYMRQNRYLDVAGADHLGKGIGSLNLKFTSAAAHSYGKKETAVEMFAGCGWDMTFDEYTRMITFAFQQGIQSIINHGFFYSTKGERANDWPPSQFFQWKYWNRQSEGNNMIRRLHYAMSGGVNEIDVLAYLPTESLQLHYLPDQHFTHAFAKGPFLQDDKAVQIDRDIQLIFNGLLSENLDLDLIHRDAVGNFAVQDGKIVNCLSGQKFSVLLLPMCEVLPLSMAELAKAFAEAGGKIIAIEDVPSLGAAPDEDERVREIMSELRSSGALIFLQASPVENITRTVSALISHPVQILKGTAGTVNHHPAYPPYLTDPYLHTGEDISGVQFTRYLKDDERRVLFMNYGNHPETIEVFLEGSGVPEVWDSLSGEHFKAEVLARERTGTTIRLTLPTSHGIVVTSAF